ncbi:MAG TPA: NAD(P)/FAD-dependent oxidoreductase [Chitinophagales bacterium]|nr:NAD(P)/FAD-dependent oxidoreductase [Chitinophagales bacterium]
MPITVELKLTPEQAADIAEIKKQTAAITHIPLADIQHVHLLRKSMDARQPQILILLKVEVYRTGETYQPELRTFNYQPVSNAKTCHIIGMGPAGMYAALQLLERGIKPIILERGKQARERVSDLSKINRTLTVDPDSNYCFGEGGAGTYSDGKLYTRSTKRGDIKKVLDVLIQHGADERIAYEAHPHIGTNKLPRIIEAMRQSILDQGGEVHFNKKVVDFTVEDNRITQILCADGDVLPCQQLILATGHSARDIFELLHRKHIAIEAKPFALGVRIEHAQALIDSIQYKRPERGNFLPPSSYSLVTQACNHGVFSFCMCPGGVIAPCSTTGGETVVNGWSSSARNGPFANSGMVVSVDVADWKQYSQHGALAALEFQKQVEQKAFAATGSIQAPAQRVEDFIQNKPSKDLPRTSYLPGILPVELKQVLPQFVTNSLREALVDFGKKMRGYRTNDAVLIGVESRTSSPVRIPRDKVTLRHPQISNLLPCGEGAGYAGGIVSAAMDGMACANAV